MAGTAWFEDLVESLGFSAFVHAKAARLTAERVPGQMDLWEVQGDHGAYRVRYDKHFEVTHRLGWFTCTCPGGERAMLSPTCSHALAVLKAVLAEEQAAPRPTAPHLCPTCGTYTGRPGRWVSCTHPKENA